MTWTDTESARRTVTTLVVLEFIKTYCGQPPSTKLLDTVRQRRAWCVR